MKEHKAQRKLNIFTLCIIMKLKSLVQNTYLLMRSKSKLLSTVGSSKTILKSVLVVCEYRLILKILRTLKKTKEY